MKSSGTSNFERIWPVLEQALQLPESERVGFVTDTCGEDAGMRARILSLLDNNEASLLQTAGAMSAAGVAVQAMASDLVDAVGPGSVVGDYRLQEEIGSGGMSRVYIAKRQGVDFDQNVALKLMRSFGAAGPDSLERFTRERRILASLSHPNIAGIVDGGVTENNRPYLVMEYVDGLPITEFCERNESSLVERLSLFIDVCRAIEHAHQRSVVHRDIKPSNILVTPDGHVKLLDFGIAKLLGDAQDADLTRTGLMLLTPQYAAPEQVTGDPVTTATDIYALGMLLFELVTGTRPWDSECSSVVEQVQQICHVDPARASTVAARAESSPPAKAWAGQLRGDIDKIVAKAVAKSPRERYGACDDLVRDIQNWRTGQPVSARSPSLAYVAAKFVRRHSLSFALTLAIAILSITLAWSTRDRPGPDRGATALPSVAATNVDSQPGTLPGTAKKSVAVLPFVALSNGPDDGYFADGLTEEILNALAHLPGLLVTARTSAFSFRGEEQSAREIAAALNVQHIVEGSVRHSGDRLRVTAQLVRAADGVRLWSDNYDSTSADAITVQEDIAEQIALALDIFIDDERRARIRQHGFRDVQAFANFQRGFEFYNLAHGEMDLDEGLRQANAYFDQVIEVSPDASSRLYVLRADRNVHRLLEGVYSNTPLRADYAETIGAGYQQVIADYEDAVRVARFPVERALYDVNLALVSDDWNGIIGRLEQVLDSPQDQGCAVGNYMQNLALVAGYADRYLQWMSKALSCDPRYSHSWQNATRAALWAGDRDEALRLYERGAAQAPGSWLNLTQIRTLIAQGRFDEADRRIDSHIKTPRDKIAFKALLASQRGDRALFDQLLEQHRAQFGTEFYTLLLYAWGGHIEQANRLAAAMDAKPYSSLGLLTLTVWCSCGAPWDLEATPNFAANIAKSGLAWPPRSPMEHPLKTWD